MAEPLNPDADAVEFLRRRSPLERHAIARVLDVDGPPLAVLDWIVAQPDCDLATLAMTYWRVACLPPTNHDLAADFTASRHVVLGHIRERMRTAAAPSAAIAWDGREAWDLVPLVDAPPVPGIELEPAPPGLAGPFGTLRPEPALFAFLDEDYATDDIFDSMWRHWYLSVAVVDWLDGKSAAAWLAAIDDLMGKHPDDVFAWMVRHPDCPEAVGARLLRDYDDDGLRASIRARWRGQDFATSGIEPPPAGRDSNTPDRINLYEDFNWWVAAVSLGGLVPRPRARAIATWRTDLAAKPGPVAVGQGGAASAAPSQAEMDRNFRRLNLIAFAGAALTIAMWRTGFSKPAAISMIGLLILIPIYAAFVNVGSVWRQTAWWTAVAIIGFGLAFLFRYIDKGVVF